MKYKIVVLVSILLAFTHVCFGEVHVGAKVTFYATADGTPAPTFQWHKDGLPIPGATGNTLVIPKVSLSDAGVYFVEASNIAGSAKSNLEVLNVITLKPKEAIDTHEVLVLWQTLRKDVALASLPKCLKFDDSKKGRT